MLPNRYFSISNKIEEKLYPDDSVNQIINDYGEHENAFVRRAILTSLRFIGSKFSLEHIDLVRRGLKDENNWVVYDSAWILYNMTNIQKQDMQALKVIAGNLEFLSKEEIERIKPEEANEYASKQAAEALQKHNKT